jgi:integrase/recombinase XerD
MKNQPALRVVKRPAVASLERDVKDYLAHVASSAPSLRTLEFYQTGLERVMEPWCRKVGITATTQLTERALEDLSNDLQARVSDRTGRPLARASVRSYLRAVRQFVLWAKRHELAAPDLVLPKQVKLTKQPDMEILSRTEINALEQAAPTERDKLIIRVLGDGGLRLGELLGLATESLLAEGNYRYLKVTGKGDRTRKVPVQVGLYLRLRRFAEHGRPTDLDSPHLFVSLRRRPASGQHEPLDERAVQQMLRSVAAQAGIRKRVNPHTFRHSMITNCLRERMDSLRLASIVGHVDLKMIQSTYAHLAAEDDAKELMRVLSKG